MDENNQCNKQYSRYIRWSEEDNCWVCVVPELPGCQADGDTPQKVWDNAERIIQEWHDTAKQLGGDIPKRETREITPYMKRAVAVKPMENYILLVKFDNGEVRIYNCHQLLRNKMFSEIADVEFFNKVHVDDMGVVSWSDALDISPFELYENSQNIEEFIF